MEQREKEKNSFFQEEPSPFEECLSVEHSADGKKWHDQKHLMESHQKAMVKKRQEVEQSPKNQKIFLQDILVSTYMGIMVFSEHKKSH